jgi:arylsulfatase A
MLKTLLCCIMLSGICVAEERPVNIILIVADDLGIRDLGCYGSDYYRTPRLDKLASQGMRFTRAYAAASVCSPTRASILTGCYPQRVKMTDALPWDRLYENPKMVPPNHLKELPASLPTYAKAFRKAGYRTALFGKWHLGNEDQFFKKGVHKNYGFDEVFDRNGKDKGVEALTAKTLAFLKNNQKRPFMLTLMHHAPHVPLTCPPKYEALYDKVKPGRFQKNKTYAGMVSHIDHSTGVILDALSSLGLEENTVVIFTSDNGGLSNVTSNKPYRGGKGALYEGGILVPLIVRWPKRVIAGTSSSAMVHSVDLFPTFLDIAGQKPRPEDHRDGITMVPLLSGKKPVNRTLFWHFPHRRDPSSAVIDGDWKLVHHIDTGKRELFNLKSDGREKADLAATEPAQLKRLTLLLAEHLKDSRSQRMVKNPDWNPERKRGKCRNYGVFYPAGGKKWQPVSAAYPKWFKKD